MAHSVARSQVAPPAVGVGMLEREQLGRGRGEAGKRKRATPPGPREVGRDRIPVGGCPPGVGEDGEVGERSERDPQQPRVTVLQLRVADEQHHRVGGVRDPPFPTLDEDRRGAVQHFLGVEQALVEASQGRDVKLHRAEPRRRDQRCHLMVERFQLGIGWDRLVADPFERADRFLGEGVRDEDVDVDHDPGRGIREPPGEQPVGALDGHGRDAGRVEGVEHASGLGPEISDPRRVVPMGAFDAGERRLITAVECLRQRPDTAIAERGPQCREKVMGGRGL